MSDYRRYFVAGGTCCFTLVSYRRRPQFVRACDMERLRAAIALVQRDQPCRFLAGVVQALGSAHPAVCEQLGWGRRGRR